MKYTIKMHIENEMWLDWLKAHPTVVSSKKLSGDYFDLTLLDIDQLVLLRSEHDGMVADAIYKRFLYAMKSPKLSRDARAVAEVDVEDIRCE